MQHSAKSPMASQQPNREHSVLSSAGDSVGSAICLPCVHRRYESLCDIALDSRLVCLRSQVVVSQAFKGVLAETVKGGCDEGEDVLIAYAAISLRPKSMSMISLWQ
eukprot:1874469-Amphidinium_carterae.1